MGTIFTLQTSFLWDYGRMGAHQRTLIRLFLTCARMKIVDLATNTVAPPSTALASSLPFEAAGDSSGISL